MRMASCFMYLELNSAEHLVGAGGAPWLAGRSRRMTACQVTPHPQHTRLLPIRYHWRNDPLDTELPDQQPPFNETQGCSWLVQETGWRGTLQPGERFPSLLSGFDRPRSFWEAGTIHFLQRTIVLRSLQGKMEASNTCLWV